MFNASFFLLLAKQDGSFFDQPLRQKHADSIPLGKARRRTRDAICSTEQWNDSLSTRRRGLHSDEKRLGDNNCESSPYRTKVKKIMD